MEKIEAGIEASRKWAPTAADDAPALIRFVRGCFADGEAGSEASRKWVPTIEELDPAVLRFARGCFADGYAQAIADFQEHLIDFFSPTSMNNRFRHADQGGTIAPAWQSSRGHRPRYTGLSRPQSPEPPAQRGITDQLTVLGVEHELGSARIPWVTMVPSSGLVRLLPAAAGRLFPVHLEAILGSRGGPGCLLGGLGGLRSARGRTCNRHPP